MIRPFLKWAGGKTRVLPELLPYLPKADCLIEPFVGGGAVFLNTDYKNYVLADINPDLISLYNVVKNNVDVFIDVARDLFKEGNSKEYYLKVKDDFNAVSRSYNPGSDASARLALMQSARFLYLNRHGFNGVCRYNLRLQYNVPFGQHKKNPYFPEKEIRLFSEKARDTRALFLNLHFEHTLQMIAQHRSPVIYCDPPYLPTSETADFTTYYGQTFTADNHRHLVQILLVALRKNCAHIVISNSDTPATREIYAPFTLREISVKRSVSAKASKREAAKEVIGVIPLCPYCGSFEITGRPCRCETEPRAVFGCPDFGCVECAHADECESAGSPV
ncbi:DNA adenine methylase [Salmonella enterica subsp. enterica]|nr:DNA adenine methylase [Salmonella enterica subsp. enterica]EDR6867839.1 DNA adenine methylase [Salmonella enterica subsp. enterica]MIL24634.1 DNA adenine methylase [Salmonella enterica]